MGPTFILQPFWLKISLPQVCRPVLTSLVGPITAAMGKGKEDGKDGGKGKPARSKSQIQRDKETLRGPLLIAAIGKGGKDDAWSKSQIRREKEAMEWKQHVPPMEEFDITEEWQRAYHHRLADEWFGRRRKITEVLDNPDPKSFTRVEGLMVRSRSKWDLYFCQGCSFTFTPLCIRGCLSIQWCATFSICRRSKRGNGKRMHMVFASSLTTTTCHPGKLGSVRIPISG